MEISFSNAEHVLTFNGSFLDGWLFVLGLDLLANVLVPPRREHFLVLIVSRIMGVVSGLNEYQPVLLSASPFCSGNELLLDHTP